MENNTKQEELNKLYASQSSMYIQQSAIGLTGAILGVVYSVRKGNGFWPGVGYFILGSALSQLPVILLTTKKRSENAARIVTLEQELNASKPSLIQMASQTLR